jgi:tetratricopeptide (TPR) repeat protein
MFKLVVVLASLVATSAFAADRPLYAPPPAWVKDVPIPAAPPGAEGQSLQVLLNVQQARYSPDGDELYSEIAMKIVSPEALSVVAAMAPSWSPDTETLIFHRFNIIRDGHVIDLLGGGSKVTVLRRETSLELSMLDGRLTASVQPEGLQVGDVIDLAMTLRRNDPVLKGRSEGFALLPSNTSSTRFFVRQLWSATAPIRWKVTEGMPTPTVTHIGDQVALEIDAKNAEAPQPPAAAPLRFSSMGQLQVTEFGDWADVSALMAPLYAKASTLAPDSPLKAEAKTIAAASADPKIRAAAALRLVQDRVRYVFLGMNLGGYIPADADLTWSRRFGDCKGKTALLLALLRELGIKAEPALANVTIGDMLGDRLPQLDVFDHVLVRAHIAGKTYWLDGTRSGDRAIDDIAVPDFHWVLPVLPAGATLTKLEPTPLTEPAFESLLRIDASAGLGAPATAHAEHVFRGDEAVIRHAGLAGVNHADAERTMRDYWRGQLPWVTADKVGFDFDDLHRVIRLTMDGAGKPNWTQNGADRDLDLGDSNLGFDASFRREPGPHSDAPFAVDYPGYSKWTDVVVLPQRGVGYMLLDGLPVDQTMAGRHYLRTSRIEAGVVTMVASEQSLRPEFPASEAEAAAVALRQLSSYDVTLRAPVGATAAVDREADAAPVAPTPQTAEDFAVRGESYLIKRDLDRAIADFDQAAKLDPTAAKVFYNRGVARLEKGENAQALADFNHAIQLNPTDATALEGRAEDYLLSGDAKLARADFDAAERLSPGVGALYRHAAAYEQAGRFEAAVRTFDRIVAVKADVRSLNGRCWVRAEWGHELDAALVDCAAALKLAPASAAILDSRALVELRLGRLDDAIADYDAALRLSPNEAASLYGRGVVEARKGEAAQSAEDIAKAKSLSPSIEAFFKPMGVTP